MNRYSVESIVGAVRHTRCRACETCNVGMIGELIIISRHIHHIWACVTPINVSDGGNLVVLSSQIPLRLHRNWCDSKSRWWLQLTNRALVWSIIKLKKYTLYTFHPLISVLSRITAWQFLVCHKLTLYMLNVSDGTKTCIYISCHYSTLI